MVPGFRYHVATLAAVFLALGVGIVIGSSFVQSAIVDRLARQLTALREQFMTEVAPLREEKERSTEFIAALKRVVLANRLSGMRIGLVQTGDYPETVRKVRETLETAGATVTSVTVMDRGFPTRAETNLVKVLPRLQANHPNLPAEPSSLLRVLASILAKGGPDSDLSIMQEVDLITREGDYTRSNHAVILVGGASLENESRAETLDAALIGLLKAQGVTVAAVEPEQAGISCIPALRRLNITTVDNADSDRGGIALVLALRGEPGNYGVKQTAHSGMLPSPAMP